MIVIDELKRKVESNSLEVEDIIDLAVANNKDSIDFLKNSIKDYQWEDFLEAKRSNKVPLATWSSIVIAYLEGGYKSLKRYVISESGDYLDTSRFVIGVLENIKSRETIKEIINLFGELLLSPNIDYELSKKLIKAINLLMSFPPAVEVDDKDKRILRFFIHKFLSFYGDEDGCRYIALCALRGVGNSNSIEIIESYPKLTGSYKGVENVVIKAIKQKNK